MSYDGLVVTGWGAMARTEDESHEAVAFWAAALNATEERLAEQSRPVYRRLRLSERMHLDIETDDVEGGRPARTGTTSHGTGPGR